MFSQVQSKKVYQLVVEQIQNMIMSGQLKNGDKLPSERELADQFGVSRNSVREALRALEILGFIESRQGDGNFIRVEPGSGLFEPLSVIFRLHDGRFSDILELRRIFEIEAVRKTAVLLTREGERQLSEIAEQLLNAESDQDSIKWDKAFHFKLAELSGNCLLAAFLQACSSLFEQNIADGRNVILNSPGNRKNLLRSHKQIFKAVIARNADAAAEAMAKHFKLIADNLPENA